MAQNFSTRVNKSEIPWDGNTNGFCQAPQFGAPTKRTELLSIDPPNTEERDMGIDAVFVRKIVNTGQIVKVFVTHTDHRYFHQATEKGAPNGDEVRAENMQAAALWKHPVTFDGQDYQLRVGMGSEEIDRVIRAAIKAGTEAAEAKQRAADLELLKSDIITAKKLGFTIDEYYEVYHPDRFRLLPKSKKEKAQAEKEAATPMPPEPESDSEPSKNKKSKGRKPRVKKDKLKEELNTVKESPVSNLDV